ncbi:MAG TPA: hypothetical protein DEH78_15095 [Solibacterales bacterium]|nr:hypothetical protein [Bryobacterales bacterium]
MAIRAGILALCLCGSGFAQSAPSKIWSDEALKDWATPIAALGVRPGHFSEREYYAVPADNYQTYPVYHPDREPKGYWDWLRKQKPKPLVDASALRSRPDWIRAGERAFRELDDALFRSSDPRHIAMARDPANFKGVHLTSQGYVLDRMWVVTPGGIEISSSACLGCHARVEADGSFQQAGPGNLFPPGIEDIGPKGTLLLELLYERLFPGDTFQVANWRTFTTPWAPDPRVESIRQRSRDEVNHLFNSGDTTVFARFNGSPWYQTKIPDLHVLRYSRYIDATGTHRLRGPEDVARYAALVLSADSMEFGKHRFLASHQRKVIYRVADEVLSAIGLYLMSLEPPKNPNPGSPAQIAAGQKIFHREGCLNCHSAPNYTSGKLTPALGYTPPGDHPDRDNIAPLTAGTDPGLALKTRKGTGFYKIPSLRGVWYRPRLLHDGSVASLEEMFHPARLRSDHVRGGWKGPEGTLRAIPGHPFGLSLKAGEKAALLAFLRSL